MSRPQSEGDLIWGCFGRPLESMFIEAGANGPREMVCTQNPPRERLKLWGKVDSSILARGLKARLRGGR